MHHSCDLKQQSKTQPLEKGTTTTTTAGKRRDGYSKIVLPAQQEIGCKADCTCKLADPGRCTAAADSAAGSLLPALADFFQNGTAAKQFACSSEQAAACSCTKLLKTHRAPDVFGICLLRLWRCARFQSCSMTSLHPFLSTLLARIHKKSLQLQCTPASTLHNTYIHCLPTTRNTRQAMKNFAGPQRHW